MVFEKDLSRRSFMVAAAGLSAGILSGCGTTTALPAKAPREAPDYFFQTMAARSDVISTINFDKELADWLPNRLFEIDGGSARPLGAGLVLGTIAKVTGGRGYVDRDDSDGDNDEGGETVAFDSPDALWRTIDVTMSVTKSWGAPAPEGTVQFGIAFGGNKDYNRLVASLASVGTAVVPLLKPGFFRYDLDLYSVGRNGVLLGTVDGAGNLHFPSLAAVSDKEENLDVEKTFLSDIRTAEDLESQAGEGPTVVQIKGGERL